MDFIIQTKRLLLRPFTVEDAPALHRISNEPYVLRWMPDWEMPEEQMQRLIRYFVSQQEKACKTEARVMLAVTLEGRVIGMAGIGNKEEVDNEIETAYFISGEYAGQGYISEAVAAVSEWALQNLGLDYLIAIVETDNPASQRVVEKCGFSKIDCRMILNSGEQEEKPFYYYRLYPSISKKRQMDSKQILRSVLDSIEDGNCEKTRLLLETNSELLNSLTPFGTWLHVAASQGKLEIVKLLFNLGIDINKHAGVYDGGAINEAATEGHFDVVKYLISCNAELDISEPTGNPLFGAILSGNKDIVKLLLDSGIDASVRYTGKYMKNMDAYDFAIERGQKEIAEMLKPYRK